MTEFWARGTIQVRMVTMGMFKNNRVFGDFEPLVLCSSSVFSLLPFCFHSLSSNLYTNLDCKLIGRLVIIHH